MSFSAAGATNGTVATKVLRVHGFLELSDRFLRRRGAVGLGGLRGDRRGDEQSRKKRGAGEERLPQTHGTLLAERSVAARIIADSHDGRAIRPR
jgi:hypothetical protein